jgi:hypothetical protein
MFFLCLVSCVLPLVYLCLVYFCLLSTFVSCLLLSLVYLSIVYFCLLSVSTQAPATPTMMLPLRPLFTTMSVGTLDIEIVKARNLTGSDFSLFHERTSDPYCTLEINGIRPLIRTKVKHENNNPIWNQCFRISLNQLYDHVRLRVYDEDIDVLNVVNDLTGGLTKTIMQVGGVGLGRSRRKKDEDAQYVPSNSDDFLGGISIPGKFVCVCLTLWRKGSIDLVLLSLCLCVFVSLCVVVVVWWYQCWPFCPGQSPLPPRQQGRALRMVLWKDGFP